MLAPLNNAKVTAKFGTDRVAGSAACNAYFGSFAANGVTLKIDNLGSTERMCDEMQQEKGYFELLAGAKSYSVLKDRLEVFCEKGKLTFARMSEEEAQKISFRDGIGKLETLFPLMEGDATPHLFPILKVDNPAGYPFLGTLVDTAFYRYFDDESYNIWSATGGEVMAVGKFGDFYVCRVPGRYVSSDIALFRVLDGVMSRVETVAWAWCDEGWCNQQDAWLMDVNRDNLADIVQHYTLRDDTGRLREERMTVLVQNPNGTFEKDETLQPDKSKFEMARL